MDSVEPQHGVDNWSLERYSWDKKTGRARLTYERSDGKETQIVFKDQPRWVEKQDEDNLGTPAYTQGYRNRRSKDSSH